MHFSSLRLWIHTRNFDPDKDIPDLTGKVYVVTGGYSGLGQETSFHLLRNNATVYIAGRSEQAAQAAIQALKSRLLKVGIQNPSVYFHHLDLESITASLDSAQSLASRVDGIACIVANAGISFLPFKLTCDGIENCLAVNHLGHFAFITRLLPKMDSGGRVVVVSSEAHEHAREINYQELTTLTNERQGILGIPSAAKRYARSKLANILFANELARNYPRLLINSCHPGLISTKINRSAGVYFSFFNILYNWLLSTIGLSLKDGVTTQLYLATSPDIDSQKITAKYFSPIAVETAPSRFAQDLNAAKELWEWSETKVKEAFMNAQIRN